MIGSFPKLAAPKPADWGFGMTICIAAICNNHMSVVMGMDTMLSMEWVSGDSVAVKTSGITNNWDVLFSGRDIGLVTPIVQEAERLMLQQKPKDQSLRLAMESFTKAFKDELKKKAEQEVLGRFGLDMEMFLKNGRRTFTASIFDGLCRDILGITIDCELMIYGFDSFGSPHIFTVSNPGIAECRDEVGFWAIGSGSHSAIAALLSRPHMASASLALGIYRVCEAKFFAESAVGVGENTVLIVHEAEQQPDIFSTMRKVAILGESDIGAIRKGWEESGRPRIPEGISEKIEALLGNAVKRLTSERSKRAQ